MTKLGGRTPFSGAVVANLSPALAEELSLDMMMRGVIVLGTKDGSRASRLGLQAGDIIQKVNGKEIDTAATLRALLKDGSAPWAIQLQRDGKTLSATIER